jgi:hypothetical protein
LRLRRSWRRTQFVRLRRLELVRLRRFTFVGLRRLSLFRLFTLSSLALVVVVMLFVLRIGQHDGLRCGPRRSFCRPDVVFFLLLARRNWRTFGVASDVACVVPVEVLLADQCATTTDHEVRTDEVFRSPDMSRVLPGVFKQIAELSVALRTLARVRARCTFVGHGFCKVLKTSWNEDSRA